MLAELLIGTGMILLTVLIHGIGIFLLGRWLRLETREEAAEHIHPMSFRGIAVTLGLVLGLFVLHGIEIFSYAVVYRLLDALPSFDQAIYFSTITYSTTGYNSEGLATHWEMIAAIEGLNGFILLGWSTAFFVTVIARMRSTR
ncbi:MAG: two pore domain potassium channel family protein [Sphingomonadales bacterium]|nr:two pore domain potassium channel family protein [Sphingomonadales bacterium]PIX64176.1 MAG: transporter [Sphingomonadales bacterium CG_4_10_14_3_um_filter_58_15]NCO50388.1 two pore domain potassium channel family protein [Sphingomonadales bacterium]NCO98675.1 two pore domain potassium channel family protein [Sphingomonadales bacterium]NCP26762.1 two pore domain potassium channel family protein [Sphingomonadales bacterium]